MTAALRVFIGWDQREPDAFKVASYSLKQRSSVPVDIVAIDIRKMRKAGLYWRDGDPLASTEFTYTRFLTPTLANYTGRAFFCDCDFLWLADVADLLALAEGDKAVWCVQHDYTPKETTKMDGAVQTLYPRKNWSSLMLFNCAHPSVRTLTPEVVNRESGAYLHRMMWASDDEIGALPVEWNWLEGWNEKPAVGTPKAVHFTRGGPWFENWRHTDYADLWLDELEASRAASGSAGATRRSAK